MRGHQLLAALILASSLTLAAHAQRSPDDLRKWVGKYPTYSKTEMHTTFLALPEIRQPLRKMLSRDDFIFLTRTCTKEMPIELVEGYLIVRKCHSSYCLKGTALLIVVLKDGAIHVALRTEDDSAPRWYGTNRIPAQLPFEVQAGWIVRSSDTRFVYQDSQCEFST
jgi:hypothetical protein